MKRFFISLLFLSLAIAAQNALAQDWAKEK